MILTAAPPSRLHRARKQACATHWRSSPVCSARAIHLPNSGEAIRVRARRRTPRRLRRPTGDPLRRVSRNLPPLIPFKRKHNGRAWIIPFRPRRRAAASTTPSTTSQVRASSRPPITLLTRARITMPTRARITMRNRARITVRRRKRARPATTPNTTKMRRRSIPRTRRCTTTRRARGVAVISPPCLRL